MAIIIQETMVSAPLLNVQSYVHAQIKKKSCLKREKELKIVQKERPFLGVIVFVYKQILNIIENGAECSYDGCKPCKQIIMCEINKNEMVKLKWKINFPKENKNEK